MNCYTIEFYKKIYRALKNSYTVYSTCVRALYFELELGRVDFAEKPKNGTLLSNEANQQQLEPHMESHAAFEPRPPGWEAKSFTTAQPSLPHNRLKG